MVITASVLHGLVSLLMCAKKAIFDECVTLVIIWNGPRENSIKPVVTRKHWNTFFKISSHDSRCCLSCTSWKWKHNFVSDKHRLAYKEEEKNCCARWKLLVEHISCNNRCSTLDRNTYKQKHCDSFNRECSFQKHSLRLCAVAWEYTKSFWQKRRCMSWWI